MTELKRFIERCRMVIELDLPDGKKGKGGFDRGYLLDQLAKGVTLEEFFKDIQSYFNED